MYLYVYYNPIYIKFNTGLLLPEKKMWFAFFSKIERHYMMHAIIFAAGRKPYELHTHGYLATRHPVACVSMDT